MVFLLYRLIFIDAMNMVRASVLSSTSAARFFGGVFADGGGVDAGGLLMYVSVWCLLDGDGVMEVSLGRSDEGLKTQSA